MVATGHILVNYGHFKISKDNNQINLNNTSKFRRSCKP